MEKYSVKINNNTYELLCETWENSRAWGHRAILLKNGLELNQRKVTYYNRTWESYRYQTCMSACILDYREKELQFFLDRYKFDNNISRFKKGEKVKAIALFFEQLRTKEINALLECVRMQNFQDLKIS